MKIYECLRQAKNKFDLWKEMKGNTNKGNPMKGDKYGVT